MTLAAQMRQQRHHMRRETIERTIGQRLARFVQITQQSTRPVGMLRIPEQFVTIRRMTEAAQREIETREERADVLLLRDASFGPIERTSTRDK